MGKTIAEKILSNHANLSLKALDVAVCDVDFCYSQDGTSTLVIDSFNAFNEGQNKNPFPKYHMVIDHSAPSPSQSISRVHDKMRKFCKQYNLVCHDIGEGVCHEVIANQADVLPGQLICGADSHTCTLGAFGAFATGMGSTDIALILSSGGKNWFKVPESIKINLHNKLPKGVYAKDLVLYIAGMLKADGCTYKCLEYHGKGVNTLSMDARFTVSNMSVEVGAKAGIFMPDDITFEWLNKRERLNKHFTKSEFKDCYPDSDATYWKEIDIDLEKIVPQIAKPHRVDNTCEVTKVLGTKIDQVFIGTCTNGRLEDLRIASKILENQKVNAETRLIIAPASKDIYIKAIKEGIINILVRAGGCVITPGCGPCVGTHSGVPAKGENVLSTANRNFKGRMGNPDSYIYLASPATAAYSSIKGKISDPREIYK